MSASEVFDTEMTDAPPRATSPSPPSIASPASKPASPQPSAKQPASTATVYGCSNCSLFTSTQDPNHISSEAARHFEIANSHAFIYYTCPGCAASACDPTTLAKHFEDGCWDFNEYMGGEFWDYDLWEGRSCIEIAKDSFRWWHEEKPVAKVRIIRRGDADAIRKKKLKKDKVTAEENADAQIVALPERKKFKLKLMGPRKVEDGA